MGGAGLTQQLLALALGPGMSGPQTNEVDTFSPQGRVSVRLAAPCKAGKMKAAVGEKLGLRPASLPLFALFEGPLGAQCRLQHAI